MDIKDHKLFRPQVFRGKTKFQSVGKGWNWSSHRHIEDPLVRIYAHLHYLTSHAPHKVNAKWKQAHLRYWARTRYRNAGINDRV